MAFVKEINLALLSFYFLFSLTIFSAGVFLVYTNKKPSFLSSILTSIGLFLVMVVPITFLFNYLIQDELTFKPSSITNYLTHFEIYYNSIYAIIIFFAFFSFLLVSFFVFNINNIQDPLLVPQFLKDKKCGIICFGDFFDNFFISKGTYNLLDLVDFIISIFIISTPIFVIISTFNTLYSFGSLEAFIIAILRSSIAIFFVIIVLYSKITGLKELLDGIISNGYWGGFLVNVVNLGYTFVPFVIFAIFIIAVNFNNTKIT